MTPADATPSPAAVSHDDMANAIRALAMDAVEAAQSGHPGMPMGAADIATVLFTRTLKYAAAAAGWPDRDRFVLSAGHGSMMLYALLHLTGEPAMTLDEVRNFRQLGSRTAGHPEYGLAPGIETTTGPLGQGLANAVGMTIAEAHLRARFGAELVDHRTYALVGDGCLMEGISQEAISLAGHLGLGRLTVLYDDNHISIDGDTALSFSDDARARFEASGWATAAVDGHDADAIAAALDEAQASERPSLIACRTTIGFGAPTKAGTAGAHGAPLGADEIAGAREALGWPHAPFEIPEPIVAAWRAAGARGAAAHATWRDRLAGSEPALRAEFERVTAGRLPENLSARMTAYKQALIDEPPALATRVSSQNALAVLTDVAPEIIGGSADLTGSNGTRPKGLAILDGDDFSGRYLHYGVREHAMAAAMTGMALHGGVIPYAGTFLVFADYCRPAIRLAALMEQRVIYVMTHDSIGLGEDGPTHQPVEHLAALRAIPNLRMFRPADAVETAECWELALAAEGPSVLALSRQKLPAVRLEATPDNLCARGGYVLRPTSGTPRAVLLASGSEVALALEAQAALEADGVATQVISMACWELFDSQGPAYRAEVLPAGTARVAVEAASTFGWERYVGETGTTIGMPGFGASAPAGDLYKHFGITAEAVVAAAKAQL